jgi:hypothetical protein
MRLMKGLLAAVVAVSSLAAAGAQTRAPGNRPPTVSLTASSSRVVLTPGCDEGEIQPPACTPTGVTVQLSATATDPDGDRLLYTYLTTAGKVSGDGANTTLDLTGVAPGTYTVTVEVSDGRGGAASAAATVGVERCVCSLPVRIPCPAVRVMCPDSREPGEPLTFTVSITGGDPNVTPTFNWTVSAGTISSGQGTNSITVDASKVSHTWFTATIDVGGYDPACTLSSSCTTAPFDPQTARKFDEYGVIRTGDEKQRLDAFTAELQNDPTARGYLICYGGRRGRAGEARRRCERARTYLVSARGIDASRVVTLDGGSRGVLTLELWFVPFGATPPRPTPTVFPKARGRR